jgi:hypothetical protein
LISSDLSILFSSTSPNFWNSTQRWVKKIKWCTLYQFIN